jgi:hypothetical protein
VGEHFAWQAIRVGNPPVTADLNALHGAVVAVVNVGDDMLSAAGGHVELWGAGRMLATVAVMDATPRIGDGTTAEVALPFNTAALPSGPQTLEARLVAGTGLSTSCPTSTIFVINERATISNS